jgi:hypothetical protein
MFWLVFGLVLAATICCLINASSQARLPLWVSVFLLDVAAVVALFTYFHK